MVVVAVVVPFLILSGESNSPTKEATGNLVDPSRDWSVCNDLGQCRHLMEMTLMLHPVMKLKHMMGLRIRCGQDDPCCQQDSNVR